VQATIHFAQEFSKRIHPGTVIALSGNLGAGKSFFARALMRALGVQDHALPSPSFSIIQEYRGILADGIPVRVAHMDWYRLSGPDEVETLAVRDYFDEPWVSIIEWPEVALELLPVDTVRVHFEYVPDERNARYVRYEV